MAESTQAAAEPRLPRITIRFCTQCKWMLRAAYYAQELLSTFSTSLREVALQPGTGGVFVVEITTTSSPNTTEEAAADARPARSVLWDRKIDGGFPETKELKRRVRDVIQPGRDLGHVDRDYARRGKGDDGEGAGEKGGLKEAVAGRAEGGEEKVVQERKAENGEKGNLVWVSRTGKVCSVEGQGEEVCEDCQ